MLAKALAAEPLLREKIQTEALKQFDSDYDILVQAVKDDKLPDNESFIDKIAKYSSNPADFKTMVDTQPLLIIFVPSLPSFSAATWKTASDVPVVALKPISKRSEVEFYDAKGERGTIAYGSVPSTATIVIKESSRLLVTGNNSPTVKTNALVDRFSAKGSDFVKPYLSINGFNYSFVSSSFDNTKNTNASRPSVSINRLVNQNDASHPLDPAIVAAYKSGAEWQRDYIYYGINPAAGVTTGKFKNNYSEFITSFSFINGYDYENFHVGDHEEDQKPTKNGGFPGSIVEWTSGALTFQVSVLMNGKTGQGQQLVKMFSVQASDLFDIKYARASSGGRPPFAMVYDGLTPKLYYPNIELVPFDLDTYGTSWKFIISETDPAETLTTKVTNTTTVATNFEYNIPVGEIIKIGAKFGGSATNTQSQEFTRTTTVGSDQLGEGIIDFRSPIITNIQMGPLYPAGGGRPIRGTEGENYTTYEVTTGVISISVEPKKIY